jgi:hypothetical protein
MEWLQTVFDRFAEAFRWFYILQPWEQALRIRAGKWTVKHTGGIHFKVPYIDYIFKQNCRLRITDVPNQSVTTLDDYTITFAGGLRYKVRDVEPLYTKLHMAEDTISTYVQGILTQKIAWSRYDDCEPEKLMSHVDSEMAAQLIEWGLEDFEFILTDFAKVKTYRFITGDLNKYRNHQLQTDEAEA